MRRLVLIVEGHYDGPALANIVNGIINRNHVEAFGELFVDPDAIRAGKLASVSGVRGSLQWPRRLGQALGRGDLGGVLAVFDGDEVEFEGRPFCAVDAAHTLAERGAPAGAGATFSLGFVILRQEFESLLIAAADQLPGYDGSPRPADPEASPRGAKGWLIDHLEGGYMEAADQLRLTRAVTDWVPVRETMRGFRRLEHAVGELVAAAAGGPHVATPAASPPPEAA